MKIYIVFSFMAVLLTFSLVKSLAITQPMPFKLSLLKGDSARFVFQIQAITSKNSQTCLLSVSGFEPLKVTLDEEKVTVNAGGIKKVYGTVYVPEDAQLGRYEGKITASCNPSISMEGISGSAITTSMSTNFVINVVESIEERKVTPIPEEKRRRSGSLLLSLILVIILIVGSVYYYWKRRK